ncbi:MAG TPA: 23S rRNA (guanosine(2251)-2'-O)-methyltransferase RlmB [Anaerolinea thermolimosa]|uniref:23S rRNA (Guanosine(2251)-2'-O)-methyltransferase RlmB n=1 Tax=Anaerolinea thermolimosa TaxID=229919 RepID=A0A3D1JEP6_9CHLR|nr:23S rRNA (guanosine(2251)-2'-O)-methyltransferase RlmB [Anaerolinea thermolimosa]GAP05535.1 rRNA methylase, putative, group 3 [Anaerolinea thermolimosa]HCE16992.1 23S rRNA (guanosine(2251)-2'-O)-methyltransferase RlmB [Anaerolinea thermolimosa]
MKEWITGRNPVFEVLRARRRQAFRLLVAAGVEEKGRLEEILRLATARKLSVNRVPRQQLDALGEGHQGVAVEVSGYPYAAIQDILNLAKQRREALFVLALDLIQNPQNLGTLLRSAEAVGVHGVILPLARAAGVTPAVVHASAGASEHLLVAQANLAQALALLKEEADAWVIGLEGGAGARPVEQVPLDGPLALVVGNEGEGMRSLVRKTCDALVALPMMGKIESLNAAVAGSIVLYRALEARRNRSGGA